MDKMNSLSIKPEDYVGKPVPVNSSFWERLKENAATRKKLCIYNETLQNAPLIHLYESNDRTRLLQPFYTALFFQDWKQDLLSKRFIRDHVRYKNEIFCTAAKIVRTLRKRINYYDAIHVRRAEFQFKETLLDADYLYQLGKEQFDEKGVLYIATDERNDTFFKPFSDHYDIYFLHDFKQELGDIPTFYYGMIDQLVASKSRAFFGTWFSTFSSYINRLRGYYSVQNKLYGYQNGTIRSWYFQPKNMDRKNEMREYWPVRLPLYMREFPTSWRNIDFDVKNKIIES